MLRRVILAALSACAFSLLLFSASPYSQAQAPAGTVKPAKPPKATPPAQPPKPVTLPDSKLNLCQYGFAYAHLRVTTRKLKVKSSSKPNIVKAKDGPNGNFIILIAGKNFGDSVVTFTGEMQRGGQWVPFIQKLTVSVVTCKKPKPPGKGGGGPVGGGGPAFSVDKSVCKGDSYYYTLNIRAPDGSNSLIHVTATGNPIASASYDPASQTVSGVGLVAGATTTIPVTGEVEAVDENIPFAMEIVVHVLTCKSVQVCKGETVTAIANNSDAAVSANPRIATAAAARGDVQITGVNPGSTVISLTSAHGEPTGRINVIVKKCPLPEKKTGAQVPPVERHVPIKKRKRKDTEKTDDSVHFGISIGIGGGDRRKDDTERRERRDDSRGGLGGGGGPAIGR